MFLEPIGRTDAGNEYQSYFLVPRRIGSGHGKNQIRGGLKKSHFKGFLGTGVEKASGLRNPFVTARYRSIVFLLSPWKKIFRTPLI